MKWETHKAITRAVCYKLGIRSAEKIVNASILPDRSPDFIYVKKKKVKVVHHDRKALELAFEYLKKARKAYMKKDEKYIEYLGRALHYIQDYCVDVRRRFLIFKLKSDLVHREREDNLANINVPKDAIIAALNEVCTPSDIKNIIFSSKPKEDPREIMFIATYLTTIAIKSIFKPDRPYKLKENYIKALIIHTLLVLSPFLLLLVEISFLTLTVAMILSFVLHKLDFNYHKWKLNYEWFNC
ncbi:MAG TPA: hypothetical protein EYH00_01235 [Archaeoglobus profundus]|nr:hypothetical protein [Archaeoglobus profundus]